MELWSEVRPYKAPPPLHPPQGNTAVISCTTRELNIELGSHRFGFSEATWSGWPLDDGRITPESVISYVEPGPLGRLRIPISIDAAAGLLALFFATMRPTVPQNARNEIDA